MPADVNFARMNGLGNMILVADIRATPPRSPDTADQ
jgi:diaminopimelate epimerase